MITDLSLYAQRSLISTHPVARYELWTAIPQQDGSNFLGLLVIFDTVAYVCWHHQCLLTPANASLN